MKQQFRLWSPCFKHLYVIITNYKWSEVIHMLFHIEQIRQKHWSQQMIGRAVGKLFCLKLLPQFLSYLIETSCTWCLYSVDMHAISYGGTAKRFQCLPLFSKFLLVNIKNVHVSNSFIFLKWSKWYIFWFRCLKLFPVTQPPQWGYTRHSQWL